MAKDEDPFKCGYTPTEPKSDMPAVSPADIMGKAATHFPTDEQRRDIQFMNYGVAMYESEKEPQTKPYGKPHLPEDYLK